jgi:replicative DNA helicase
MYRLEQTILKNLIYHDDYCRKVLPFLKSDFFLDFTEKIVFDQVSNFIHKYKNLPTHEALVIDLTEASSLKEDQVQSAISLLEEINQNKAEPTDVPWLVEQTEKFCQDKSIYNAVLESVSILEDKTGKLSKGAIPDLLTKALGVSFDNHIGHDYLENSDERYDFYHRKEERIPFNLTYLNKITKGGFPKKTLNIILAGTNVGKSLVMCHLASDYLSQGKNVLYITLEMAEERIAERIDANLLNIPLDDLVNIPKSDFDRRVGVLRNKTNGKLIIKEYPTASASTLHFKALLNELQLKKSFRPDVIIVDYLNICQSSRIKPGTQTNSYYYVKSIAEELRGLAVEFNVPLISATQTTRGGFDNSDVELTDTSESFGLPATADFMIAIIETGDLQELHQYLVKQLKNRYGDKGKHSKFVIGVEKAKMRLYDVEESAQPTTDPNKDVQPSPAKTFSLSKFKDSKKFASLKV